MTNPFYIRIMRRTLVQPRGSTDSYRQRHRVVNDKKKMLRLEHYKVGITGNIYYTSKEKRHFKNIVFILNRKMSEVYWSKKYECYVLRIKSKKNKQLILSLAPSSSLKHNH